MWNVNLRVSILSAVTVKVLIQFYLFKMSQIHTMDPNFCKFS